MVVPLLTFVNVLALVLVPLVVSFSEGPLARHREAHPLDVREDVTEVAIALLDESEELSKGLGLVERAWPV